METEIKAIIEKNLPAQVGDVLKQKLEQAEKDAEKVNQQAEYLLRDAEVIKKLQQQIEGYKSNNLRNATLDTREKELNEQAQNLEVTVLKFQLAVEKEKTEFTKSVALGLVRNTEFKKSIFDSENQSGYPDTNGNWIYPTPIHKSFTETKSAE